MCLHVEIDTNSHNRQTTEGETTGIVLQVNLLQATEASRLSFSSNR